MDIETSKGTPPGFTGKIWTNPTGEEVVTMFAPGREPVHVLREDCPKYLVEAYGFVATGGKQN